MATLPVLAGAALSAALLMFRLRKRSNVSSQSGDTTPSTPEPQRTLGLRAIGEIQLPACVYGRLDHCSLDAENKLLFQSCLGSDNVCVVDVFSSTVLCTLTHERLSRPQGVLFVRSSCSLYVANAGNGAVVIFTHAGDLSKWKCKKVLEFGEEADNLRYDSATRRVLVGYGDGAIGFIDDQTHTRCMTDWTCDGAHPESFQIAPAPDSRVFVNVADRKLVQVIAQSGKTVASWPLPEGVSQNFAMCLDWTGGKLYVCTRRPSCVLVFRLTDGAIVDTVPCVGDMDDIFLDPIRNRLYVIGGEGRISVIQQYSTDADRSHCVMLATVSSSLGARTGLWYTSRDRLYVSCPAARGLGPRLLVYEPVL